MTRRRARDRHGRGLRGRLVPSETTLGGRPVRAPLAQTPGERFDELVLDAVDHLEERWAAQLQAVEFAVEDVPPVPLGSDPALDADVLTDHNAGGAVPLGRLVRGGRDASGAAVPTRVVVYRRPLEARAVDRFDLADLVHDVVIEQVARLLGVDPDQLEPPAG